MSRAYRRVDPDQPTAAEIAEREAERDARDAGLDDRDLTARLLGDPPRRRSAQAVK
jgi:hypothetical protein